MIFSVKREPKYMTQRELARAKRLLDMRKIAVILRLLGDLLIALACTSSYSNYDNVLRHIAVGSIADGFMIYVMIDTVAALLWLPSEIVLKIHFIMHIAALALLLLYFSDIGAILGVSLIFAIPLLPFIVYYIGRRRIEKKCAEEFYYGQ